MKRRSKSAALLAASVATVLTATACGGGDKTQEGEEKANAAVKKTVNPSEKKGGTLVYESSDAPDSFDPGNTYYGFVFNFSRLYARPLTTFQPGAGDDGNKIVPDLAKSLGKPSDNQKTWTYELRKGVKFDDGTEVTSKDVKHAIERSNFAPKVNNNGPTYLKQFLVDNEKPYKGPYDDDSEDGLESIETPDKHTITFKLKQPFAEFDYLVASPQSAPVPKDKDTGGDYVKKIVSSGSYKFQSYKQDQKAVLVRNKHWSAKNDPLRKQLPEKIQVNLKVNQETIDSNLKAGKSHIDLQGTGVGAQSQSELLSEKDPNTDNAEGGRVFYTALNTKVAPLDELACRRAVQYAVDKESVRTSFGGPVKGKIASTLMPSDLPGYKKFDLYKTPGNKGDLDRAKAELKKCGKPNGFSTTITARSDRQDEIDAATAVQASLKRVGIKAKLQKYPSDKYFENYAGVPKFTEDNNVGMMMMEWGADWPTGYGYLQQVVHGDAIKDSGNSNLSQLDDPKINDLMDKTIANPDENARMRTYATVDRMVMKHAAVVPLTYRKVLHYRAPDATNLVASPAWSGQYDYLNIGLDK